MSVTCLLCGHPQCSSYHQDRQRDYYQCNQCHLVFVPTSQHLSAQAEKAIYDLHENNLQDEGYRRFLRRCCDPLLARLPAHQQGLDFGCGPAPMLIQICQEQGHQMQGYDHFYQPDPSVWDQTYHFITMTEVIEHLNHPLPELTKLWQRLASGGLLAIMTKRVLNVQAFATWHYKNDQTHVAFYSEATFAWLANELQATLEIVDKDVVFLQKKSQH